MLTSDPTDCRLEKVIETLLLARDLALGGTNDGVPYAEWTDPSCEFCWE